jgi:hypothetical protein
MGRATALAAVAIVATLALSQAPVARADARLPGSEVWALADGVVEAGLLGGKCRLIDFDSVYFKDGGRRGIYLYIGGSRQFSNMDVALDQRPGNRRGDWIIEVVGCTSNFLVMPIPTPFNIEVPLRDLPGARTLRIVGSSGSITRRVPGR